MLFDGPPAASLGKSLQPIRRRVNFISIMQTVFILIKLFNRILHGLISSSLTEIQYLSSCRAAGIENFFDKYTSTCNKIIHFCIHVPV